METERRIYEREEHRDTALPVVTAATGIALAALALAATIAAQDPVVGAFLGSGDGIMVVNVGVAA